MDRDGHGAGVLRMFFFFFLWSDRGERTKSRRETMDPRLRRDEDENPVCFTSAYTGKIENG